jgi:hypothetical protein
MSNQTLILTFFRCAVTLPVKQAAPQIHRFVNFFEEHDQSMRNNLSNSGGIACDAVVGEDRQTEMSM